jgi:6-phosphogluconolactonase
MSLPQSHLLFTGSYAATDQPGLRAFSFDTTSGALSQLGSYTGLHNPSFIVAHPNGRWLYAVSETSEQPDGTQGGGVCALAISSDAAGQISFALINSQSSGGGWPCHLTIDASGRWLLAANYGGGNVVVLPIREDGGLGPRSGFVQHQGSGPNAARQEGPHAHSTIVSPDNRFVIVADLGIDRLAIYRLDAVAGTLASHGWGLARPGAGPRHMAFHPGGRLLYVANELDCTVSVYSYDPASGMLEEQQALDTLPPGAPASTVADIHLNPAGDKLLVSNRGHNSLAVFAIEADGMLRAMTIAPCGGDWPRNFAIAPSGDFVLVANQYSSTLDVLPLGGAASVGEAVDHAAIAGASCVQFGPSRSGALD